MQWVVENGLLLLVGGAMVAMHLFGLGHRHTGKGRASHYRSLKQAEGVKSQTFDRSEETTDA